ncbi:unnamed protein product [Merluccius merluccius]
MQSAQSLGKSDDIFKQQSVSILCLYLKISDMAVQFKANLALSPGSLLPSPRTPEVKLQRPPSPPSVPCTPPTPDTSPSPPPHVRQSSEEEEAVCFESPPEGAPLPSFNKTRARLSFARRPPSRRHRRSPEEERVGGNGPSPWQPEPAGPGVEGGSGRDEPSRGRPSRDPAVRPHQSEGEEEDRAQMAGGEDVAERADDVTPRGAGPEATAGQTEVTTQDALRREEREAA